jgi:hypothetical protein
MPPLGTDLRDQLRKAITAARREGESGARRALEALAVPQPKPHDSMTQEERELRNRLRAHGRQLGDVRDTKTSEQSIERLVHEVAYEQWHRMLFARFLAENGLLIEPESEVAITLDECEELAREMGEDPHAMAARFAQGTLPQIFRVGDPVLELELAPETRQALERLLDDLPRGVFTADDSLGWTYQFWQSEKKDEINASGVKIGADELPAVTQLFTEHYMVQFLFHNTIGAWHAGKVPAANPDLAETAEGEDALRRAARLKAQGGYDFEYLRFVREAREGDEDDTPTGPWRPAAGSFEGWPKTAKDLKVLDPCCGSGHFLVEGFELLVRLRMDEEGLSLEDAIRRVLADNLYGLELDPRCTQIAAFNLALAAWKLAGSPIHLPPLNVACSGLAPNATKEEWLALADDAAAAGGMPASRNLYGVDQSLLSARLKGDLAELYELFEKAPVLGSLIDPRRSKGSLYQGDLRLLQPLLAAAIKGGGNATDSAERVVAAQGMLRATELLSREYTLVITNVPFLSRGKQSEILSKFTASYYQRSKADLSTAFIERWLQSPSGGGTVAAVTPQNWLFLPTYKSFRRCLLKDHTWNLAARLGSNAFQNMNFWAATTALSVLSRGMPAVDGSMTILDVSEDKAQVAKAAMLAGRLPAALVTVRQSRQIGNPDSRISLFPIGASRLLARFATSPQGIKSGDDSRFRRCAWEVTSASDRWRVFQGSSSESRLFSGLDTVIDWSKQGDDFARLQGQRGWGRDGVVLKLMGEVQTSVHIGELFDSNVTVLIPKKPAWLPALLTYCASDRYGKEIREAEQAAKINNATAVKVPFDLNEWKRPGEALFPNGVPEPFTNDPNQWLFHGHPCGGVSWDANAGQTIQGPLRVDETVLQIAVSRLLGHKWPPELDTGIRISREQHGWAERCRDLRRFADSDGIVCLSPLRGERSAAGRLRELLAAAYEDDWTAPKERELLDAAGNGKKPPSSLEDWLCDRFFEEHCKLFQNRPFVWHIWDGRADGFNCLVNAHRLTGPDGEGRRTLESLTYSYLGRDWIERQREEQRKGREGADGRLAAALDLQHQLEKILEGEPPYDIFVRWKSLHEQAIGWAPDINDGIRLNIRPFMSAGLQKGGRKGAGILRWKPNVKWGKDRGKEPESLRPKTDYPWFWSCPGNGSPEERTDFTGGETFDGNRWNDLHYTNAAKRAARERALKGATP